MRVARARPANAAAVCAAVAVIVLLLPVAVSADVLLNEDFSRNPHWDTDQPENFFWKSDTDTYFARTYTGAPSQRPNRFGVVPLPDMDPTRGFTIRWDQKLVAVHQAAMVHFGIFADDLLVERITHVGQPHLLPESTVAVGVGRDQGGSEHYSLSVISNATCCGPGGSHGPSIEIGTWYRFSIEYVPAAGEVRFRGRNLESGETNPWFTSVVSIPDAAFSTGMVNVGVANDPIGYNTSTIWYLYPNGYVESEFDNVFVEGELRAQPPAANFSFAPATPAPAQTIQFTDTSTGSPVSWSWNFGDGNVTTTQNPTHAFASAGSYTVSLTASNAAGSDTTSKTVTVATRRPDADFSWFPASPKVNEEVQFTETSSGSPSAWSWAFGDGATSTLQNPRHTYSSAGSFDVTLTATNAGGSDSVIRPVTITAPPGAPVAAFTFAPSTPKANQEVQFTNTSTGGATSWTWTFGDGGGSDLQHPKHTFASGGTFLVTLTAANAQGQSVKSRTIRVTGPPVASFGWTPLTPKVNEDVQFTDASKGDLSSWSWDFGDGGKSSSRNPKHTFSKAGSHDVRLTVKNPAGSDDEVHTITVAAVTQCEYPQWGDRKVPTTDLGQELEAFARSRTGIPENHRTLHPPLRDTPDGPIRGVDPVLHQAVEQLKASILAGGSQTRFRVSSGYRPPDYQDHFRRLRDHYQAWYPLRNTSVKESCAAEIREFLDDACDHGLGPSKANGKELEGTLGVNARSNHERGTALDVSVSPMPSNWQELRGKAFLHQPCSERSIHLQLMSDGACSGKATVSAKASSPTLARPGASSVPGPCDLLTLATAMRPASEPPVPIRILLHDPQGRRIGYDPVAGQEINEIGDAASYSGVDSDPQIVTVSEATGGVYRVEAVVVGSGAYVLTLAADDPEEGTNFGVTSASGSVVPGDAAPAVRLNVPATTSVLSARRRTVRH